jgi:hypothetical protein
MSIIERLSAKKQWSTPQLTNYGSVEKITEQINVQKETGTGDSITLTINGVSTTINDSTNGPPISITVS